MYAETGVSYDVFKHAGITIAPLLSASGSLFSSASTLHTTASQKVFTAAGGLDIGLPLLSKLSMHLLAKGGYAMTTANQNLQVSKFTSYDMTASSGAFFYYNIIPSLDIRIGGVYNMIFYTDETMSNLQIMGGIGYLL